MRMRLPVPPAKFKNKPFKSTVPTASYEDMCENIKRENQMQIISKVIHANKRIKFACKNGKHLRTVLNVLEAIGIKYHPKNRIEEMVRIKDCFFFTNNENNMLMNAPLKKLDQHGGVEVQVDRI